MHFDGSVTIWPVLYFMALNYPVKIVASKHKLRVKGYRDFLKSILVLYPDTNFKKCLAACISDSAHRMKYEHARSIFFSRETMCTFVHALEKRCRNRINEPNIVPNLLNRCSRYERYRSPQIMDKKRVAIYYTGRAVNNSLFIERHCSTNGFTPIHWGSFYWSFLYGLASYPVCTINQLNAWVSLFMNSLGEVLPCGACRRRYSERNKSKIVRPLLVAAVMRASKRAKINADVLVSSETLTRIVHALHARVRSEVKGDILLELNILLPVLSTQIRAHSLG